MFELLVLNKAPFEEEPEDNLKNMLKNILLEYFGERDIDNEEMSNFLGDCNTIFGNYLLVYKILEYSAQPVFLYNFEYCGGWKREVMPTRSLKSILTKYSLERMNIMV